jgi:hypothetical protein
VAWRTVALGIRVHDGGMKQSTFFKLRALAPWALALMMFSTGGAAMAVEEPEFRVDLQENNFEVRTYPALLVAQVSVEGSRDEAVNAGFRMLANFIFGVTKVSKKLP